MPCRPCEESRQGSELVHPLMPTKPTHNKGASHADSDAEAQKNQSEEEEELAPKKKPPRHVLKLVILKRWVTCERAVQDEDVTQRELKDLMRELMDPSCQRKHKALPSDKGFWKLGRSHTDKRGITYVVHCFLMRYRCKCNIILRVVTCPDFIKLQQHWLHDKDSCDKDNSKTSEYVQVVSVVEAVKSAPTLSCAALRRNLQDHDSPTKTIPVELKRCVERVCCAKITKKQLDGFYLDDTFESRTVFCGNNLVSELCVSTTIPTVHSISDSLKLLCLAVRSQQNMTLCALPSDRFGCF
jgi:hypothetical protein